MAKGGRTREAPGRVALTCPHCRTADVELGVTLTTLRSYVLWARWGKLTALGCRPCVRRIAGATARRNLLVGWWSIPWGLATPFVAIGNITAARAKAPGTLDYALTQHGVNPNDVKIGTHGLTGAQTRIVWLYAAIADQIARAGRQDVVTDYAVAIISALSENVISGQQARGMLPESRNQHISLARDPSPTDRRILADLAVETAFVKPLPTQAMLNMTREILSILGVDQIQATQMFAAHTDTDDDERDGDTNGADVETALSDAYNVLGVAPSMPLPVIRAAYHSMLTRWHPDHAAANGITTAQATVRTQQITAAYHLIVHRRRV